MSIIKPALLYFISVFGVGFVLGIIRVLLLEPNIGKTFAVLIEAPFMVIAMIYFVQKICLSFHVPQQLRERLLMGFMAFAILMLLELAMDMILRDTGFVQHFKNYFTYSGIISLTLFLLFALMPSVLLLKNNNKPTGK